MTHYRLLVNQDEKGPYTLEQLRSMWASGMITADAHYWTDGMNSWQPIAELGLDSLIQVTNYPSPQRQPSLRTPEQRHDIHLTREVTTKAKGSGIVAIGSIMCIVGLLIACGGFGMIGVLLLIVGFFIAAAGRLIG